MVDPQQASQVLVLTRRHVPRDAPGRSTAVHVFPLAREVPVRICLTMVSVMLDFEHGLYKTSTIVFLPSLPCACLVPCRSFPVDHLNMFHLD